MIWWLIVLLLMVGFILCCTVVTDDELQMFGFGISIICTLVICACLIFTFVSYETKVARFNTIPINIQNKVDKIDLIKNAYRNISVDSKDIKSTVTIDMNVDMVNKNLTERVTLEIKDLEQYINKINIEVAEWKVKQRLWFFTHCHVGPPIDIIKLSDYTSQLE